MTRQLSHGMKHEIAERYMAGETASALADEFNINKSTVRRITEAIHPGFRKTEDDHGRS